MGLVDSYARRMLIETSISDGVDFFHMDALSSAVAMKVNCDLQLTLRTCLVMLTCAWMPTAWGLASAPAD